tara:strand:+ start:22655 stop:22843 length:189 start_codon:yes stop_codon:yes gene_type:complete
LSLAAKELHIISVPLFPARVAALNVILPMKRENGKRMHIDKSDELVYLRTIQWSDCGEHDVR